MTDLRARAQAARGGPAVDTATTPYATEPPPPDVVVEYALGDEPEAVPVKVAWSRVMRFCRAVPKGGTATIKTDRGSYSFVYRGIDDILNAVGPALRLFGVEIFPIEIEPKYTQLGRMNVCTVVVTYSIVSLGDGEMITKGAGEGADVGERATTKAQTYAYRNMLIAALCLPTIDPRLDADVVNIERPEQPAPMDMRDEILDPETSLGRLRQMKDLFRHDRDLGITVVPVGEEQVTLWDLLNRVGRQREAQQARRTRQADDVAPTDEH